MDVRHKSIRASQFVLSTLKPMQRIALDTIGPMDISKDLRDIIVVIDTFTSFSQPITLRRRQRWTCKQSVASRHLQAYGTMAPYHTLKRKTASWRGQTRKLTTTSGTSGGQGARRELAPDCMTEKLLNFSVKKPLGLVLVVTTGCPVV